MSVCAATTKPAHLEPAHLEPAHLEPAHLEPAHLEPAHLEPAHLEPALGNERSHGSETPVATARENTRAATTIQHGKR